MSMKIIHKISPGLAFQNSLKHGDNPVGSFISGIFGLAGTEATNESNEDIAQSQLLFQHYENQLNRDYNTKEAEKARMFEYGQADLARQFTREERLAQQQWQQQQWEFQQRNQLPLQMESAREAGLNPNVAAGRVMSAQGGSVSSPSGASSPIASGQPASFSGGISPVPYQALNPVAAFAQAAAGLQSLASAKEKGANVGLIEKQIENMAVDTQYKNVLKDGVILANKLSQINLKYADKKLCQDLAEQIARTATIKSEMELHQATARIQDSIRRLNESLANKHDQESQLLMLEIGAFDKRLTSQLRLQGAQIRQANAEAFEAGERAKTEKEIRPAVVRYHNALANIHDTKDFVSSNTAWNEVQQSLYQLQAQKLIPDQMMQTIENAKKHNDWFVVQQLLGIADEGLKAYGTYYGAKTGQGFVNAQDVRNRIQSDFNSWQMQDRNTGPTYNHRNGYPTTWH